MARTSKSGSTSAKSAARKPKTAAGKPKQTRKPKIVARKPKAAAKGKVAPKRNVAPKRKTAKVAAKPKAKARVAKLRASTKPKLKPRAKAKPKAAPQSRAKARTPKPKPKPQASVAPTPTAAPKPQSLVARLEAENVRVQTGRDWSETLFLPKTDFPMKAGLPVREPELLERWEKLGLYQRLRQEAMGREKFILHDGPPYANGHIHIGTGLNKILKDVIVRSQQMMGKNANYVPGWDCHGLPIEWKVEEENYRAKGKSKPDLSDSDAMIAFRAECRAYARALARRAARGVQAARAASATGTHPYTTMSFDAEATIAAELMKFAMNGLLYRGSKPVMWSVVERTALAEAEVEYEENESPCDLCEVSGDLI